MTIVMTNRQLPREHLRLRIEQAALALFRERGYSNVSVEEITAGAGVSKGAFFNFFPAKEDALAAWYDALDRDLSALRAKIDPKDPLRSTLVFFRKAERQLKAQGPLLESLLRALVRRSDLRQRDVASAERDRQDFAKMIRTAQLRGALPGWVEPEAMAAIIGDIWTGSLILWLASDRATGLAAIARPKLHFLFGSLVRRKAQ